MLCKAKKWKVCIHSSIRAQFPQFDSGLQAPRFQCGTGILQSCTHRATSLLTSPPTSFFGESDDGSDEDAAPVAAQDELAEYMKLEQVSNKVNPTEWWKERAGVSPNLEVMASGRELALRADVLCVRRKPKSSQTLIRTNSNLLYSVWRCHSTALGVLRWMEYLV